MKAARALGPVLITGAQGFLGRALAETLRGAGAEVVAADIVGTPPCDITDPQSIGDLIARHRFGTILHCGAVSGPTVMADAPERIWRINATGTVNILEAARRFGVGRVVLCSSSEIYGETTTAVDEETQPQPINVYAASKLAAEVAMLGYLRQHGVDAVALRLAWIYGPERQTPSMLENLLRAALAGGGELPGAHPKDPTHYIHIDDAVAGVLAAARTAKLDHRIYNISSGPAVPMAEIIATVERLRPSARLRLAPEGPALAAPTCIDNSRAAIDLGFRPAVTLEDGLQRYLASIGG